MLPFYQSSGVLSRLNPASVAQAQSLFAMDDAAAELAAGRLRSAMRLWEASGFLPFGPTVTVEVASQRLQTLPPSVLPELLVLAETTAHRLYQSLMGGAPDPARQQEIARVQEASRRLVALTSRLHQRLPPDAYGRLVQMDVFMN